MIKAEICVKDIDYDSLLRFMVPLIENELENQDNPILRMAARLIGKNGEPTGLSSLLVSVIPKKEQIIVSLLPHFDKALRQNLNAMLMEYGISAEITGIESRAITIEHEAVLRLGLTISNINYEASVDVLLPALLQILYQKENKLAKPLSALKELPAKMIKAAIGVVPPNQRDELVIVFLKEYKEEIRSVLVNLLKGKNIRAKVSRIRFTGGKDA
jgi:hypothetical protein